MRHDRTAQHSSGSNGPWCEIRHTGCSSCSTRAYLHPARAVRTGFSFVVLHGAKIQKERHRHGIRWKIEMFFVVQSQTTVIEGSSRRCVSSLIRTSLPVIRRLSAPNVFADKKLAIYKLFIKLAAWINQISTHPEKRWTQ